MKELAARMLAVEVIDELVKLVIREHHELFTRAILNVMERHPNIWRNTNAEVQEEDH